MPRAIIFDMDGTIVQSERQAVEAVASTLETLGYTLTQDQRDFIIGRAWQQIWARYRQELGITMAMSDFIELYMGEYEKLSRAHATELPGARTTIRRLATRWPLTLVSGSSRREIAMHMGILGLLDCFPWYLGADDYQKGKPDPEPYLLACQKLGVAPASAVVIEDSQPGIRSARAAGIPVIAVRAGNFNNQDQSEADLVVDTLNDVTDAVLEKLSPSAPG